MGFTKSHRTPVQLTAVARAAAQIVLAQFAISAFLPAKDNYTLSFNFEVGQTDLPAAASFRSFNTESDVGTTPGGAARSGKLPPISRRLHVDEHTELVMYGQDELIGEKFDDYARRIAAQIAARLVLAQGEAIETGKVTLAERGLSFTIDFGRSASHTAVAASGVWTGGASTPIADLEAARTVYNRAVEVSWISPEIMTALQKNADVMKMVLGRGSDLPSRVSRIDVESLLASEGFGRVIVNEQSIIDTTGASKRVVASDKYLFLPDPGGLSLTGGVLGTTDFGVTAESIQTDNGIAQSERPGLFSGAIETNDPEGFDVLVSAIGLPVVTNADATFSLDVL